MSKKYEEMTREELGKEADEILKRFRIDTSGDTPIWVGDIDNLQQIVNVLKNCRIDSTKEKVDNILGGFLERNKDYAVELYINNAVTNSNIGNIFIVPDRICNADDKKLTLKWNKDENYDVRYNDVSIMYDEVMACYEKIDKEDNLKISETVVVILKNGMEFSFGCIGMRI